MKGLLQSALEQWAPTAPRVVGDISRLHEANARVALSSSLLAYLVAKSLGLPIVRNPDDADLLIPNEDLPLAANLLGADIAVGKQIQVPTSKGSLQFTANEVTAHDAEMVIQMVCPTTPVQHGKHAYNTAFTEGAASARQVYETNYGLVPVAVTDALYLYGVLGRNVPGKTDAHNAALLRQAFDPLTTYAENRAREMNLDTRALQFIASASLSATTRQAGLVSAV